MQRTNLLILGFLTGVLSLSPLQAQRKFDYPAPRYLKIPKITTVEELLPYARKIVNTPIHPGITQRPVYGVKEGEKVLINVSPRVDYLVVEAFKRAFEEKNCQVDVISLGNSQRRGGPPDGANEIRVSQASTGQAPQGTNFIQDLLKSRDYDLMIGSYILSDKTRAKPRTIRMPWYTREMLATAGSFFPEELAQTIDRKGWEILRQAQEIHLIDPEGTDVRWSIFPEHWAVMEGTHPTIRTIGMGYPMGIPQDVSPYYAYGQGGTTERPLIGGHLAAMPLDVILERSDAEGVVGGTTNHAGMFPHIKLTIKNHQVVEVEGGGEFGRRWRDVLEKHEGVQYPMRPRPGHNYFIESSIGTNPFRYRPHNVMEDNSPGGLWVDERGRSGVIHLGFGVILWENRAYGVQHGYSSSHSHIHLYFPTLTVTTRDGRQIKLIDKGHLTVLDDPEVRQVAAKYGDPDELLQERWIPAIPGINVEGDYFKDYANDPAAWIKPEHREAYADIIDFKPY